MELMRAPKEDKVDYLPVQEQERDSRFDIYATVRDLLAPPRLLGQSFSMVQRPRRVNATGHKRPGWLGCLLVRIPI